VRRVWREDRTFKPQLDKAKRAQKLARWERAVSKA
jgi:glycerol kinase